MTMPLKVLLCKETFDTSHAAPVGEGGTLENILREAGFRVYFEGLKRPSETILKAAMEEDVDVIGISSHNDAHKGFCENIMKGLKDNDMGYVEVILGGIIPKEDLNYLRKLGVRGVFRGDETSPGAIVDFLSAIQPPEERINFEDVVMAIAGYSGYWEGILPDAEGRLFEGDRKIAARFLSLVEKAPDFVLEDTIMQKLCNVNIIKIGGPPDAGKSTFICGLLSYFQKEKPELLPLGFMAFDPVSLYSDVAGANFGDVRRLRPSHRAEEKFFIRSMGVKESDFNPASRKGAAILSCWGAKTIIVETAGLGQGSYIKKEAGEIYVHLDEPMGDVQARKAGPVELADLVAINKKNDRERAEETAGVIRDRFRDRKKVRPGAELPPVFVVDALEENELQEVFGAIVDKGFK